MNVCQGAKSARDFIGGAGYVIGWKTDVVDSAAVQFSEQYYRSIKDGDSVEVAYFHAITNMQKIYDWQFDLDPSSKADRKKLREKRDEMKRTTLKIAGVPAVFRKGADGEEKVVEVLEPTPEVEEKVEQKRRSTYGDKLDVIIAKIDFTRENIKEEVKEQGDRVVSSIENSTSKILKSVFECSEFDVPTTFVILPYKIEAGDEKSAGGGPKLAGNSLDKAGTWISKLTDVINVVDNDVSKVRASAASRIQEMFSAFQSEEMYMYLVDEEMGELAVGAGYPIVIKAASPKAKEFVPLMSVGLKALCVTNKVAGLAKCLGLPAPTLMTKELHGLADNFITKINEKSSVAGFDCLQSAVDEGFSESLEGTKGNDAEQKRLRGSKLREFKRFLEENDSKKGSTDPESGFTTKQGPHT